MNRSAPSDRISHLALVAGVVIAGVAALVVVALLIIERLAARGASLKEVDLAAWVQAVGSILAIVASVALVSWSAEKERGRSREEAKEKARRFLLAVLSLVEQLRLETHAIGSWREMSGVREPESTRTHHRAQLQLHIDKLHQVPLYELPSGHAIERTMDAIRMGQAALRLIDEPSGCEGTEDGGVRLCGPEYGRRWLPVHAYLQDYVHYLRWELDSLDNPSLPHPSD